MTTTGIVAISLPTAYYYGRDVEFNVILAQPQSLSFIWDVQTINSIGNQYRLQVPDEESKRSLVKLLGVDASAKTDALVSALEEKINNDFETGNTIMVDGWILSVTEARQCALASSIQPK